MHFFEKTPKNLSDVVWSRMFRKIMTCTLISGFRKCFVRKTNIKKTSFSVSSLWISSQLKCFWWKSKCSKLLEKCAWFLSWFNQCVCCVSANHAISLFRFALIASFRSAAPQSLQYAKWFDALMFQKRSVFLSPGLEAFALCELTQWVQNLCSVATSRLVLGWMFDSTRTR